MSKFFSVPGTDHSGDRVRYEKRAVRDPLTGEVLYERDVAEAGYDPGFDSDDGLHWNGARLEKVGDAEFDRHADRNVVTYRAREDGGNRYREIEAHYERDNDGHIRLARYREKH